MRLAILITSNNRAPFARRFPDDGQTFRGLLRPLRPDWRYTVFKVFDGMLPQAADEYDGYIITGSLSSVHDREPWIGALLAFIQQVDEMKIPLVGICFGHRAVALALGGEVCPNPDGWEIGARETHYLDVPEWMNPNGDRLTLYCAHREQVGKLPNDGRRIGTSRKCAIAALSVGDHIMTTQYRPELSRELMDSLVNALESDLGTSTALDARLELSRDIDSAEFAKCITAFFESAWTRAGIAIEIAPTTRLAML